jgi:galactofuranose transport system permease protein
MSRRHLSSSTLSTLVTLALFALIFAVGAVAYPGFLSVRNFLNLFLDNAYLLILSVGMTFVIISGGIDLSVGSMLALSTMVVSSLLEKQHTGPLVAIVAVLLMGTLIGFFHGVLIQVFDLAPFIVTLAGLYLARGLCYVVSIDTIAIKDGFFQAASNATIPIFGDAFLKPNAVIALTVVAVGAYLLRYTRFGRIIYAIGGNEQSALLMGLPVARTKIGIYAVSGFCSALAGIMFTFETASGYALNGKGMELDAIASVVIGGTLLTGGAGSILGTVLGVLVYGTIQLLITFGSFNSWWTRIAIGVLIFLFCSLQLLFQRREIKRATVRSAAQVSAAPAG